MARVVLENVTKRFGKVVAVQRVNLEIADHEFIVLVGPSGCGKTTTLRMIAGLEDVTEGSIYIGDTLVNNLPPQARDIAMVFQNYALYPHLNVYQNMAFGLKLRRVERSEIDRRVKEAARMLGIEDLLDRKPAKLSGGQRQRVALGRAIVREAKVFLMDEPLSNLDAKLRVQMRAELAQLHHRLQNTTIYVTHDQTEAMTMGDRIVVMKDGVIQQVGAPLEIYNRPANMFVGGFIGSPPMNFIHGVLKSTNHGYEVDAGAFRLPVPAEKAAAYTALGSYAEKPIVIGIRPEDIRDGRGVDANDPELVSADVEVVEPMGSETIVYFSCGNQRFHARLDPVVDCRTGTTYPVRFNMAKAHFFDPETEAALQ